MGLQKTETTEHGFTATDAYHKIILVDGDPKGVFKVLVGSFISKAAADGGSKPYIKRWVQVEPDLTDSGANVLADAYAKVKASTTHGGFFSDATDVIE